MVNNKYLKQLVTCLEILRINSKMISGIWDKEVEENDGFLSEDKREHLNLITEKTTSLLTKYENVDWASEHKSTIKSIYSFMSINNSSKKNKVKCLYGYNYEKERAILPNRLLDSTMSLSYTMNYLANKLKITVDRENLQKEISELFNLVKDYVEFTEDELILDKYLVGGNS